MISQDLSVPEIFNSSAAEENQVSTSHTLNSSIALAQKTLVQMKLLLFHQTIWENLQHKLRTKVT